jgi:hypothetical protein
LTKKFFFLFFLLIIIVSKSAYPQPKAVVQFFGGYSLPISDLKGVFGDTSLFPYGNPDTNNYGMANGLNYGISFKKSVIKTGQFNLTGSILFNSFGRSKDYQTFNVNLRQSIFTVALGGEVQFSSKKSKVNPFVGLDLMLNFFNGSFTITYPETTTSLSLMSAFRMGFMAGGGIDFAFHQNVGIVIGAKYAYANLIGKDYKTDTQTKYNLGDREHYIGNAFYPAKKIQFIQFYAGASFYFGK